MKKVKKIIPILLIIAVISISFSYPKTTQAAATLVQTAQGGYGYVNSFTQSFTSNVGAGDMIVIAETSGSANTISSITDSQGDTYTLIASNLVASNRQTWMYYAYNVTGGATTITVTLGSGQYADNSFIAREYSGLATGNPLDVYTSNADSSAGTTHFTGTTAATTQPTELVVVASGLGDVQEPGWSIASYSDLVHQKGSDVYTYEAMADNSVSSTGTQSGTFTTADTEQGQSIIATFKISSAPVTVPVFLYKGGNNINRAGNFVFK
jgi:hypothetical protein